MKTKLIFPLIASFFMISGSVWAQEATPEPASQTTKNLVRSLQVEGTSLIEVAPDIARFRVGVSNTDRSSETATEATAEASNRILNILREAGIVQEDIVSDGMQIGLVYKNDGGGLFGKPDEYIARSEMNVTVRDLTILSDLLGNLGESGANEMGSLDFDVDDRVSLSDQAMLEAVDDANRRATAIAERAGMTLGEPIDIRFGSVGFGRGNVNFSSDVPVLIEQSEASGNYAGFTMDVSPGLIRFDSRVEIQYELVSKP